MQPVPVSSGAAETRRGGEEGQGSEEGGCRGLAMCKWIMFRITFEFKN